VKSPPRPSRPGRSRQPRHAATADGCGTGSSNATPAARPRRLGRLLLAGRAALFGLGQLFIPNNNTAVRQYAFQLLLSIRPADWAAAFDQFPRAASIPAAAPQEMPLRMVNLWLGVGVALIVGVMFAALLLPRPNAEYAISDLPIHIGSPEQHSSPYGMALTGSKRINPTLGSSRATTRSPTPRNRTSPATQNRPRAARTMRNRRTAGKSRRKAGRKRRVAENAATPSRRKVRSNRPAKSLAPMRSIPRAITPRQGRKIAGSGRR